MDTNTPPTPAGGRNPQEEVRDELQAMGRAAAELMEHLIRVPAALAQIPLQYMPDEAATHARNAASEGFKAVKTLLDSLQRQVDQMIDEQGRRASTQTGASQDAPPRHTHTSEQSMGEQGTGGQGAGDSEATRRFDDTP